MRTLCDASRAAAIGDGSTLAVLEERGACDMAQVIRGNFGELRFLARIATMADAIA